MKKKLSLLSLLFVCIVGSAGGTLADAYMSPETVFAKELECENEMCRDMFFPTYYCGWSEGRNCKLGQGGSSCTESGC